MSLTFSNLFTSRDRSDAPAHDGHDGPAGQGGRFGALRAAAARAARSPLVHFIVIGGAIFALAPRREDTHRIDVPSVALASLQRAQAARDGVPSLSAAQTHEVDARAIEDEVLAREALRLGLDKDDPIIRQRLIQKLLLLVEDMGGASRAPTDDELRAYLAANAARFEQPARVHFVHVFATRREGLPAKDTLDVQGVPAAGEPFPYARDVHASRDELARNYGAVFAAAAFEPSLGASWSEPVASTFGWHRVRIVDRQSAHPAAFDEVRSTITLDYALDKRAAVVGAYLKKTVGEYRIDIDGKPVVGFVPTQRIAVRSDPSAED